MKTPTLSNITYTQDNIIKMMHNNQTLIDMLSIKIWASGWLLFNANSAIFQLYHVENKLIFKDMMMRSAFF
jgi:hypothetical protein